jgi:hypothetical protein
VGLVEANVAVTWWEHYTVNKNYLQGHEKQLKQPFLITALSYLCFTVKKVTYSEKLA